MNERMTGVSKSEVLGEVPEGNEGRELGCISPSYMIYMYKIFKEEMNKNFKN